MKKSNFLILILLVVVLVLAIGLFGRSSLSRMTGSAGGTQAEEATVAGVSSAWDTVGTLPWQVYYHEVVSFGGYLWSLGGIGSGGAHAATLASRDSVLWRETSELRRSHHCSVVYHGRMWAIGGRSDGVGPLNTVLASTGFAPSGTTTGSGSTGSGTTGSGGTAPGSSSITWTPVGKLPISVTSHACAVFQDKIWLMGGIVGSSISNRVFSSADGVRWREEANMPLPLADHSALDVGGNLFVTGGRTSDTEVSRKVLQFFRGSWIEMGTDALPYPVYSHDSVVYANRVFLIGGAETASPSSMTDRVITSADGLNWIEQPDLRLPVRLADVEAEVFDTTIRVVGGRSDEFDYSTVWYLQRFEP